VHLWRPAAVWLGVGVATVAAGASTPDAWAAARSAVGPDRVVDLVVAGCASALTAALGWLWMITTATVVGLARGRVRVSGGATRRLVLLACGVAVATASTVPAQAAGGDGAEVLVGLPLPERAVAPARPHRVDAPAAASATSPRHGTYVVRAGDSLWSIARHHPGPDRDVDERWRAIWAANRAVVGDDPDLIHPGQALRLPGATSPTHDTDGAR
jgi:LysM repeat protein